MAGFTSPAKTTAGNPQHNLNLKDGTGDYAKPVAVITSGGNPAVTLSYIQEKTFHTYRLDLVAFNGVQVNKMVLQHWDTSPTTLI